MSRKSSLPGHVELKEMHSLLKLIQFEQQDEDFDLLEALSKNSSATSWRAAFVEAKALLCDLQLSSLWPSAMAVCYWAYPHVTLSDAEKTGLIARLYWCLLQDSAVDLDENLVWSITIGLTGVNYESDWDPMQDPAILALINSF